MKAGGRAVAMRDNECLAVLHESAAGNNGSPYDMLKKMTENFYYFQSYLGFKRNIMKCVTHIGTSLSESQHISNRPNKILDTSMYGSQTVNPRPIKSIAALLKGVCGGFSAEGPASSKNASALPETLKYVA